jgi:hypothetical protein
MFSLLTVAIATGTMARSARHWIYQLGGLGFIPLGLLDNSVIPLPGSMDVLTIFLSAHKERLWFYYASMATAGSVIGGFVTYRLARKGGKETLARRFPARKEIGEDIQDLRALGLGCDRHSCPATATRAHASILVCGRHHAISSEKIPVRAYSGTNRQVHTSGLPGGPLWTTDTRLHFAACASNPVHRCRADCNCGGHNFRCLRRQTARASAGLVFSIVASCYTY